MFKTIFSICLFILTKGLRGLFGAFFPLSGPLLFWGGVWGFFVWLVLFLWVVGFFGGGEGGLFLLFVCLCFFVIWLNVI